VRVLILNWKDLRHPDAGGAEVVAHEHARRLVARGHRVTWFCRAFAGCSPAETVDGIVITRRGGVLTTYGHGGAYYLRTRPYDIVVDMVNTLCWQTPLYVRAPVLAYVHQLAQEVLLYNLPRPVSWVAYGLERFQYFPYRRTRFVCPSESTRRDLVEIGIPGELVGIVPNGLDHARHLPAPERRSPTPLFLFVGRLAPMKRARLCVEAMPAVLARRPDARLVLLGSGPEEARVRGMIAARGLEHAVELVTRDGLHRQSPAGDRKVELMQRAWALLLPSVKEGWGMVVIEAAACGTPSIVSNVSGLRDSVRADETGLVLAPDPAPGDLADAMLRLIDQENLRARLSHGALQWAGRFDWERSFERFFEELEAVARP
jgi:glycosyltransferase involved in cell wall biosynthesis